MKYQFNGFTFDADTFELASAAGETVALQPRALELLYFLLRQPRSLARKEDILREVWGGVAVSSGALSLQVFKLREALGDSDTPHQLIQTIKRQGLRLDADVNVLGTEPAVALDPTPITLAEPSERAGLETDLVGSQPTIAVLEFAQDGDGEDLHGLTRALPTDIITELARFQLLRVISGSSSFLFDQS
ncbi:MAG: winged helix-turn-helix domain-containing protein, partial [Pseudomonadota bacterium]